jgi:cytidyltransferase-like protein
METKLKKIGLIPGRFAPFHKGHELLFKRALNEMDEVICLIFDTDDIPVPLDVRANWIKVLYPTVTVIEGYNCPNGKDYAYEKGRVCEQIQNDYILQKLNGILITHVYSSELYGASVANALNAQHVIVDLPRNEIRISGTEIRQNPTKYKDFMDLIVYNSFINYI